MVRDTSEGPHHPVFVPLVSDDPTVAAAIDALHPDDAIRIRPRYYAQDGTSRSSGDLPVVPIDRAAHGAVATADAPHLAVSVPVGRFEDLRTLTRRIQLVQAHAEGRALHLLIDVPAGDPSVIAAVATGALRRVPDPHVWASVAVCLTHRARLRGLLRLSRVLARDDRLAELPVRLGEAPFLATGMLGYTVGDRWVVSPIATTPSPVDFAQLIVGHVSFGGERCCAGDRWLAAAASGEADSRDLATWRWAALVHWMTTTVRIIGQPDDGDSATASAPCATGDPRCWFM